MTKSIIYYTDNELGEPIYSLVQEYIKKAKLPIVSASLESITFGDNEVVRGKRSYPTMVRQIISCLSRADTKYVFFCEHDVLYHKSHFDFTPIRDDIFYYNENVWRWLYGTKHVIRHQRMISLSGLCVNREYALKHFQARLKKIIENGWDEDVGQPKWLRLMGYEPGTKKRRRGGFSDEDHDIWRSESPNIDVRHDKSFTRSKTTQEEFKHKPLWWKEISIDKITGWDIKLDEL